MEGVVGGGGGGGGWRGWWGVEGVVGGGGGGGDGQQQRLKKVPVLMYSHAPKALRLRRQATAVIAKQQRGHEEKLHLFTGESEGRSRARGRVHCGAPMLRRYAATSAAFLSLMAIVSAVSPSLQGR